MKHLQGTVTGATTLAVLLALGACGQRDDAPSAQQANVEINRQGMDGAKDESVAAGVDNRGVVRSDGSVPLGTGDTSVLDPDVRIAEQVKAALVSSPDFGALPVEVRSDDGDVTLTGRAPDPLTRERATEIARSVREVKDVDNQLTVG